MMLLFTVDAADLLDLAAGDRLPVGDQCQGLQGGAGVFGLALGPQPRHPRVDVGLTWKRQPLATSQFHAAFGAGACSSSNAASTALSGAGSSSGNRPLSWTSVNGWWAASRAASTMR